MLRRAAIACATYGLVSVLTVASLQPCVGAVTQPITAKAQVRNAGTETDTTADNVTMQTVTVTVVDGEARPVSGAIVEAVDASGSRVLGRTDNRGVVHVNVPRGAGVQARAGSAASAVEVPRMATLRLVVNLRVIGSVRVQGASSAPQITAASAAALLSGDVANALGYVPNYRSAAQGGSGRETLNGIPLDLPAAPAGAIGSNGGIPTDLISSFDAVQADDGSVEPDYHLLSPSAQFTATAAIRAASFDGSRWKATVAGPHGNFGYALALAGGGDQGTLVDQTFTDASGLSYNHGSGAHHFDASLTAHEKIGTVDLALVGVGSRQGSKYIATTEPGHVIQGLGPENLMTGDTGFDYILATRTLGRDSFHAIDVRYNGGGTFDLGQAINNKSPTPSFSGYRYSGSYDEAGWSRAYGAASLSLMASATQGVSEGFSDGESSAVRSASQGFGVEYKIDHGADSAGASVKARHISGDLSGSFVEADAFVAKRIDGIDGRFSIATTQSQTEEASYVSSYVLGPAQTASIVCSPGSATIVGPSLVGQTHPRAKTIQLSLARSGNTGSIKAGAFRSDITNALVMGEFGNAVLPPDYVASLNSVFDVLCPNEQIPAANILLQQYVSVPVLRQTTWYISGTRRLGPLTLQASYETFSDVPLDIPASLARSRTTLRSGAQLPGVPLHRGNVIVAYAGHDTTFAVGARFLSENNEDNLPSYVALDAGARLPLGPGVLEVSAQNLVDPFPGLLTSPQYAIPIATTTQAPLGTLATPLLRTWAVQYTLAVGPRS